MYQQISKLLSISGKTVNYRYEPYLWNIKSAIAQGNPYDMSQLHHYGLWAHKKTPLFLDGSHPVHDRFLDHLFDEPCDDKPSMAPDAYLTKVIRGSGRLRSYLAQYPDLKIIACIRNPLDTINSSLGMFSFFGEEFHADDRDRFRDELEARGGDVSELGDARLSVEWYAAWWRAMTDETIAVANDFPDNVFLFCHEAFQKDTDAMLGKIMDFVGIHNIGMMSGLSKPAGSSVKATSLTLRDIHKLEPQMQHYFGTILEDQFDPAERKDIGSRVLARYCRGARFSLPIAGGDVGRKTPIQLREMIMTKRRSPFLKMLGQQHDSISITELRRHFGTGIESYDDTPELDLLQSRQSDGLTIGAVVVCRNHGSTIVQSLLSCLNQTRPFDEIVVVNDRSQDESRILIKEIAQRYSEIRVVDLHLSVGEGAACNMGVQALTTDYFTRLDGDEIFWPNKNAMEANTLADDLSTVAHSDAAVVDGDNYTMRNTKNLDGVSGGDAWKVLISNPAATPRSMTLSRQLFFDVGSYSLTQTHYAHWEFCLRLAARSGIWRRPRMQPGVVSLKSDRLPVGVNEGILARNMSQIFIQSLKNRPDDYDSVLADYDALMAHHATRHIARAARGAIARCLTMNGERLDALAAHLQRRDLNAVPNLAYATALESFEAHDSKVESNA